ncbi:MAG: cytochrome c biogenesis protein DipZ [Actinobacteria bacterium]|nr:MAG: cytochrome c biogenesis protein DipZ [Actinomycetota bacterium]
MSGHFLLLLGIAVGAGVITAISPCVFPVLPILFAGGGTGSRRRPVAIIAGLIASFAIFTLFATWILKQLGLPQDFLRNLAIALLFLLAATLVFPQLGLLLERPLYFLSRRRTRSDLGGGFLFGASLGLVFVPCAGPVLGAISANAARVQFGWRTILVTVFYSLGAAVPMLAIVLLGEDVTRRLRASAVRMRLALGVVMALAALAIVFNADQKLQTWFPGYTDFLQSKVERNSVASKELAKLQRRGSSTASATAPRFTGIDTWINSPPLTLAKLRGKVVLVDFWTYSCINCLRTLPHLEAWDRRYRKAGLVIVGVHTPEFAFEHVVSNVRKATRRLGVRYPVAIDNGYKTWDAYRNDAWPAEYLIDRRGQVREVKKGEGNYGDTERKIQALLGEPSGAQLASVRDRTPQHFTTPESYLGWQRLQRYAGSAITPDRMIRYRFPKAIPPDSLAYSGSWTVEGERIVAGRDARLRLSFIAQHVYLVLSGRGRLDVLVNGKKVRTIRIGGLSRLYTLLGYKTERAGLLELRFTPGISAYAFTFG